MASLILLILSIPLAMALGWAYGEPQMVLLLPVCMVSNFFSGHSDILSGLVRRQRRFTDLAIATLIGNAIGITLSVVLALLGAGVWALIAQRILITAARAVALQARARHIVLPSRSLGHLRDLVRYGGFAVVDRMIDNLIFLAFNYVVAGFYGLNTLGHVNMAMRLVEPIRGAIGATGHNLAFSFFARLQNDPEKLRDRAETIIGNSALATAPVFVGLAAVTPVLLPLVAGPGWDESIGIGICLAIGSAIVIPSRLFYTAFSARAKPEISLLGNVAAFAVTLAVLILGAGFGPISVGLARIAADLAQTVIAIAAPPRLLAWSRLGRFMTLAPAWCIAALMGVAVVGFDRFVLDYSRLAQLVLCIVVGVALYGLFLSLFARSRMAGLTSVIGIRVKPAGG
jgi:O-antigen/teichoic acid export membrane protein